MQEKNKKFVGAYIDSTLKNQVEKLSKKADRSLSYILSKALEEYLKKGVVK